MGQSVNVPGVGILQFPDGMSQDDMSAAIQKNYPQLGGHSTQSPADSPFVKGIKDFGNETARVGAKAITGLPLMAGDFFTALGNAGSKLTGGKGDNPYPSDLYNAQLDQGFAPPTNRTGKISEGLSTLIASLGLPGPAVAPEVKTGLSGADAVKAATLRDSQEAGYVVPPNQTRNVPIGPSIANGWGGKVETNNLARARNQPVTNALAAGDIGLPPDASLTTAKIKQVIQDAANTGYGPLRDIGEIPADQAHADFLSRLAAADRGAANIDPSLGNPQIAGLAKALDKPSFQSADMVDAISALRGKAQDAASAGNKTLGAAYKQAANGLESLIDRHLQDQDSTGLLNNFRQARQTIAKAHDVIGALNPATGDVDAKALGTLIDSGDKLSGGLKAAGMFGRAFGDVAGRSIGEPSPVTAFQANTEGASGPTAALLNLLGRPIARKIALSNTVQRALMQPKGKTLSAKALDAIHANPAAFGSLYEDQAANQ